MKIKFVNPFDLLCEFMLKGNFDSELTCTLCNGEIIVDSEYLGLCKSCHISNEIYRYPKCLMR
jgi:hypothetical protein